MRGRVARESCDYRAFRRDWLPDADGLSLVTLSEPLPPLCIDLDGTLVKSDTLHRFPVPASCAKSHGRFGAFPSGYRGERPTSKLQSDAAPHSTRDGFPTTLNSSVTCRHSDGRAGQSTSPRALTAHWLAASPPTSASLMGYLPPTASTNLTGNRKLRLLKDRLREFDYIGNSRADLPLLGSCAPRHAGQPNHGLAPFAAPAASSRGSDVCGSAPYRRAPWSRRFASISGPRTSFSWPRSRFPIN